MEGDVWRWSLEFFLGKSKTDSNLIKKMISRIPISDSDSHLRKAILLKTLEDELSKASIAERMLEILEVLEEVLRCEGSPISAAMRAAYCGVAVECTLKYLEVEVSNPSYVKAVERIWRGRVQNMEPSSSAEGSLLFTAELKRWRSDIEASLSNPRVMDRLAATVNTRRDAINKLKVYLSEAWANVGPSFPEFAAEGLHRLNLTWNFVGPTQELGVRVSDLPAREQQQERVSPVEIQKDNQLHKGKCTTSSGAEEMDPSTTCSKIDSMPSHEVPKIGESLECGSLELQTLARDPLPNSIDIVRSELPIKDRNQEPPMENQSRDATVPDPHACQSIENNEANLNETTSDQSDVHRPSLMQPNSTARTHEWDDSIDGLPGGTSNHANRFHLPSPKRKKLSPLKKYEAVNVTKRRKHKKWSQLEEETLRTAVSKFGRGNWKSILNSYKDVFEERTEVDLKDKWRNMSRYGGNLA